MGRDDLEPSIPMTLYSASASAASAVDDGRCLVSRLPFHDAARATAHSRTGSRVKSAPSATTSE